jgi:glyoxylase-like metal-dependent hydrolase (beta-lactamase superfamily II)
MLLRWLLLAVVIGVGIWAFSDRRMLIVRFESFMGEGAPPPLLEARDEGPGVTWYDDYFIIQRLANNTYAIGEPRYQQENFSYLIIGEQRALLFDAGPGIRDIRLVAESLTDKPITFLPSHLHYDHVGNEISFERIALPDLASIRERSDGKTFSPSDRQHLGMFEGFSPPVWHVSEWLPIGSDIDLGGRSVKLLFTPGHTNDSVSLFDAANNAIFSGDYLYPGELYAFLPNSNMGDYLATATPLIAELPEDVIIYGAHRAGSPGTPVLAYQDLLDLKEALVELRSGNLKGEGTWPQAFHVNDNLTLLAEPRWLQDWD